MKLGFIGFGNMAQALAHGFLHQHTIAADDIYGCAKHTEALFETMKHTGFHACANAREVAEFCDVIIIAVKPQQVEEVVIPIIDLLVNKIVVSIATGYSFAIYESLLATGTQHITMTPNLPCQVGKGILLCEEQHSLTPVSMALVSELFSTLGTIHFIPAKLLGISATLAGCGPAFASLFIEALRDAGVCHGLDADLAESLATQMILGTTLLLQESDHRAHQMKTKVCVPGGTSIAGIAKLEKLGFRGVMLEAIDAVEYKRHHHD